jgi:hypothetical protein
LTTGPWRSAEHLVDPTELADFPWRVGGSLCEPSESPEVVREEKRHRAEDVYPLESAWVTVATTLLERTSPGADDAPGP